MGKFGESMQNVSIFGEKAREYAEEMFMFLQIK